MSGPLILCCGSRGWPSRVRVYEALARYAVGASEDAPTIMHGNASGADLYADEAAREFGFPLEVYPADWKTYGRKAGPMRNRAMLDRHPDFVLAFWDGKSRGTLDTITEATKRGVSVTIIPERPVSR